MCHVLDSGFAISPNAAFPLIRTDLGCRVAQRERKSGIEKGRKVTEKDEVWSQNRMQQAGNVQGQPAHTVSS